MKRNLQSASDTSSQACSVNQYCRETKTWNGKCTLKPGNFSPFITTNFNTQNNQVYTKRPKFDNSWMKHLPNNVTC